MKILKTIFSILMGLILGFVLGFFLKWHQLPLKIQGEEFGSWAEWISEFIGATGILVSLYIAFSKENINVINNLKDENNGQYKLTLLNASPSIIELFPITKKNVVFIGTENGIYHFGGVKSNKSQRVHEIQIKFTECYFAKLVFLNIVAGQKVTIRMRKTRKGQWKLWHLKFLD